jgi:hypothetical protein
MILEAIMPEVATNSDLDPELSLYSEQVQEIKRSAEELIRDLTAAHLLWKPKPEKWSISQCLDHLVATARTELPLIHRAIAHGQARGLFGHSPFRYSRIVGLLVNLMGPSPKLKFNAPRLYLPADTKDPDVVIREFFQAQSAILDCFRMANGLHLARTKMSIYDYKYIRLSLGQGFKLFVVHEQRHILQAQRIKAEVVGRILPLTV